MASLFDPLGLLAPLTVLLKLIFQDVCKGRHSWDEPLPKDIVDRWEEIISDIRSVGTVEINCHVLKNIDKSDIQLIELHGFSDGSSVAFAATIYLRAEMKSGIIEVNLVASKAHIALMKGETIPRMELMSALILARLITTVSNALEDVVSIDNIYCWQDSQITLWWIYGTTKEFRQFVQNCLVEIRKLVNFRNWKYCPSDDNPSDITSLDMKLSKLMKNSKRWKGPEFLSEPKQFLA